MLRVISVGHVTRNATKRTPKKKKKKEEKIQQRKKKVEEEWYITSRSDTGG